MDLKQFMDVFKKFQEEMQQIQKESESKFYFGDSGAGLVTAKVSGKLEVVNINITKEAMELNDKSLLEDLIVGAINKALEKAKEEAARNLQKIFGPISPFDNINFNL
ncbi:MAG: YbaB/EbfC family nucleoid-associated protein [Candidatus Kapaibacteriota bacterium]